MGSKSKKSCAICHQTAFQERVTFFSVPVVEERRRRWIKSCGPIFKDCSYVCSRHFARKDFIEPPGSEKRARLLPSAVPTENIQSFPDPLVSQLLANRKALQVTVKNPGKPISKRTIMLPNATTKEVYMVDCETQTDTEYIQSVGILENMDLKKRIRQLETEVKTLKKEVDESEHFSERLRDLFSDQQLRKLRRPDKNVHWTHSDIVSATQLHAAGHNAYMYLYKKGFPLPSVSTIHKWAHERKLDKRDILQISVDMLKGVGDLSDENNFEECVPNAKDPEDNIITKNIKIAADTSGENVKKDLQNNKKLPVKKTNKKTTISSKKEKKVSDKKKSLDMPKIPLDNSMSVDINNGETLLHECIPVEMLKTEVYLSDDEKISVSSFDEFKRNETSLSFVEEKVKVEEIMPPNIDDEFKFLLHANF